MDYRKNTMAHFKICIEDQSRLELKNVEKGTEPEMLSEKRVRWTGEACTRFDQEFFGTDDDRLVSVKDN